MKMTTLSPGQIHLAGQRGLAETNVYRRYFSFNYDTYFSEHRHPFGRLEVLNDELLAANQSGHVAIINDSYFVLIPVTGEIMISDAHGNTSGIDVGEVFISRKNAGDVLELTNPYDDVVVNYLYLQIAANDITMAFNQKFTFDIADKPNELINITRSAITDECHVLPFSLHIGQFEGRTDTLYHLQNKGSLFYAFVIAGAFEAQGRLMHERDGLALWDLQEADMEALSNNAVMLVIEMDGDRE